MNNSLSNLSKVAWQVSANHIFHASTVHTDRLSLAFIDWRSGAVKVGQVGGFKVSRQDALDLAGQWPCGHPGEQGELVRF